jgi:hypothetical protein
MLRASCLAVLVGLGGSGPALAQTPATPAATALERAAFAPRPPGPTRPGVIQQRLGRGERPPFYLYAGANSGAQRLDNDPRWSSDHETRSANALVNTRFGVGWERDDTRVSLGYLRRQLPNPGGALGEKPRRDSMVGLSVSIHPKF